MLVGGVILLIAVRFVADAAFHNRRLATVLWSLGFILAVLLLTHVMKHYRIADPSSLARTTRVGLVATLIATGVALLSVWSGAGDSTGLGFLGLTLTFLGIAWGVAELRESTWLGSRGGWWLLAASIVVAAGATGVTPAARPGLALVLIGVSIMIGQLGIVLASHQVLRRDRWVKDAHRAPLIACGAILTLAMLTLLWTWAGPLHAGVTIVAIGVLIGFTTSRGEWDSIMIAFAFLMIWALAPQNAELPGALQPDPADDAPLFVAFGDSYMSGEGADRFFTGTNRADENECRRSPTAWAARLVLEPRFDFADRVPDEMIFLACSGARVREIWQVNQGAEGSDPAWTGGQIGQFQHRYPDLDLDRIEFALVSIGGNDANFAKIGQACVVAGDCSEIAQEWLDALEGRRPFDPNAPEIHSTLEAELVRVYRNVREAVGGAPVIVVPYPQPVRPDGCDFTLLAQDEHRFIAGYVDQLNAVIRSAAERAGAFVLDSMPTAIVGGRLCDSSDRDIHMISPGPVSGALEQSLNPTEWIHNSFHPKPSGHHRMATAAAEWFAGTDLSAAPTPIDGDAHDVPDLPTLLGSPPIEHCDATDAPARCDYRDEPATWALIQFVDFAMGMEWVVIILVAGAWLISLAVVHRIEGGDQRDFDAYEASRAERATHWLFRWTGLDRLVGGFPHDH